jgi:hypothetical protein
MFFCFLSLHIRRGFLFWEMKDDEKKISFRHWESIPKFFIAPLPICVWCKTKGAAGAVCAIGRWDPNSQLLYEVVL